MVAKRKLNCTKEREESDLISVCHLKYLYDCLFIFCYVHIRIKCYIVTLEYKICLFLLSLASH